MRILLVDDDEILVDVLQRTLGERNYTFDAVLDGEQGWTYGSTYNYDLIILDWSLPKLDGISLCKRFRAYGYQMPILLLTTHHSSQEKIIGLDAGADDYLCKPFNVDELAARIRALLRRSHSNSNILPILTWGDLQLDTRSCQVTYQGEPILLTGKEYQLLELFLSNRQEVFSIEEIMENLWSSVEYPSEATVRSHLRHLRQKLKQAGLIDDPIETLRGRGYCLKAITENKSDIVPQQLDYLLADKSTKQQHHLVALSKAWQKYRYKSQQQLTILQKTLQDWQNNGSLSVKQIKKARSIAHKLAGTVGVFGFNEGSQLATELELLLQENNTEELGKLLRCQAIFTALQQELITKNLPRQIFEQPEENSPLLLIVDHDQQFTELLRQQAMAEKIETIAFPHLDLARNWLGELANHQRPHVILLRLSLNESISHVTGLEEYLSLIRELNLFLPSIPVIVIADRDRFQDRLLLAQQGTTFFLKQPVTAEKAIAYCQKALERSPQSKGKKVMIVDDDVELLRLLPSLLEPWGFKITTLDDPRQFWDVLQAVKPDLLVLDIEMPYLSGIELCKVLRTHPYWYKLPILYLSIHRSKMILEQAFTSGADELVPKPVESKQLANRITYHLGRTIHTEGYLLHT